MRHWIMFLLMVMILPGCSLLSPVQDQQKQYVLEMTPKVRAHHKQPLSVLVTRPRSTPVYDTDRIAYSPRHWEISYFVKNRWATKPSDMLQGLLVQTLVSSHAYANVSNTRSAGRPDLIVNSELLAFRETLSRRQAVFEVTLKVVLQQGYDGKILAVREFHVAQPVKDQSPYGVVTAANQAVAAVLRKVAFFCMNNPINSQDK